MGKVIKSGQEARELLQKGISTVSDVVRFTMGPRGENIIIHKPNGSQLITNDGVTIANSLELSDRWLDAGSKLVRNSAKRTEELSGDGTSTTILLCDSIVKESNKLISTGYNPMMLKRGLEKATTKVVAKLEELSIKIKDNEYLKEVATISANNDSEVGELIAKGFEAVGTQGTIVVDTTKAGEDSIEIIEGTELENGYISEYFSMIGDTDSNGLIELDNPLVLMYTGKITNPEPLAQPLKYALSQERPLLIIADKVEGKALDMILANVLQGGMKIVCIEPPSYDKRRKEYLEDLAILTGGKVINHEVGELINQATDIHYGSAETLKVNYEKTIILGGVGTKESIQARVSEIEELNDSGKLHPYEVEKNLDRIGKLTGKVAKLTISSVIEDTLNEKVARCTDSLQATKSALTSGVLPGGGIAYLEARKVLTDTTGLSNEEVASFNILSNALTYPTKQIVENSGKSGEVVLAKLEDSKKGWTYGFNALTLEYCDMMKVGVIDSAQNNIVALKTSVDVAKNVITTRSLIVEEMKEK